jgi:hypothetical protein
MRLVQDFQVASAVAGYLRDAGLTGLPNEQFTTTWAAPAVQG